MSLVSRIRMRLKRSSVYRRIMNMMANPLPRYPLAHYYSSIPSREDLDRNGMNKTYTDLMFSEESQLELLGQLSQYYSDSVFVKDRSSDRYYYLNNRYFPYSDAVILFTMLNKFKPDNVIELGSGFSTACMLDAVLYSGLSTKIKSFDIHDERLNDLVASGSRPECLDYVKSDIRDIALNDFSILGKDDILFVDSSHVSKYNSDLNYILFSVMPELRPGVLIHFHDVFKDFEYPKSWLEEGIFWNEQYLIRAFLQNNKEYEILLLSDHMEKMYETWYSEHMPLCLTLHEPYIQGSRKGQMISDIRGQSLWLRKL